MGTPLTVAGPHPRDRIVHEASRLFAERGYDATSTRAIADAVGLNIATVAYHVGGKGQLYREVMRAAHQRQQDAVLDAAAALAGADASAAATRAGLHGFVDAYLSFCLDHPEVPALWMRRWLSDGDSTSAEMEQEFIGPLVTRAATEVRNTLARAGLATEADLDLLIYTVVWTIHSFSRAGVVAAEGHHQSPTDDATLARFRRHLHRLVDGTLGLE